MIQGVGIDFVELERFDKALKRHGPVFLERIFTPQEIKEGLSQNRNSQGWAARFSAKEAVFKAIGCDRPMLWHEIEILLKDRPFPEVVLGPLYKRIGEARSPYRFHLSLSHTKIAAVAVAILELFPEKV
ncbi:holo-ACP synthase [bacterium]|nr:holo-ACP synthase [bacterium]